MGGSTPGGPSRRGNGPNRDTAAAAGVQGPPPARWGIVLAGGEGARMRPLIHGWLGEPRPKQYCTFVGRRSMLEHTLDRALSVVPAERMIAVIGRGHRRFLSELPEGKLPGLVLEQPDNMGTAPGVFLPTTHVLANDPEATVFILPSDHFAHPEDRFCRHLTRACDMAEKHGDKIILVGAVPDRAETDYGWITPAGPPPGGCGAASHDGLLGVEGFQEKPGEREARALLGTGTLWNTMVMAAKAKTLWACGRRWLSEMMGEFDALLMVLRAVREGRLTSRCGAGAPDSVYRHLVSGDFSRDLLQHVSGQTMVLPLEDVDWCDWGRPGRVTETLARLGLRPLFPPELLKGAPDPQSFTRKRDA